MHSGRVRMLTHQTRYFAPALSPDLQQLVCVKVSLKNIFSLAFISPLNGKLLMEAASPENALLQDPTWSADGTYVVAVLSGKKGKALYKYTVASGGWEELVTWGWQNISTPVVSTNQVFYSSDAGGTNNIYAYQTSTKKVYAVTKSKFGAFDPIFNENRSQLYFSDYSSQGFTLKSKEVNELSLSSPDLTALTVDPLLKKGIRQEEFNFQDSAVPAQQFITKRYSKLLHTINIHSWTPFYYDYSNFKSSSEQVINPGLTLLSQDKLGTCVSSFGIAIIDGNPVYKTNFTYKGWFPVVNFSMNYGSENSYSTVFSNGPEPTINDSRIVANTQVYLPLNLTHGKYITTLTPFVNWEYDNWKYFDRRTNTFVNELNTVSTGITFSRYLRLSFRDIAPRLGISMISEYFFKPLNQDLFAERQYIKAKIFLPGAMRHHSLQLTGGYFNQTPGDYMFTSSLAFPRGYKTYAASSLNTFSADYTFPLLYPDFQIGQVLYMKRIRSNLFVDWGKAIYSRRTQTIGAFTSYSSELLSSGIDLLTDTHILRIMFPLSFGIRTIYFPNERTFSSYIIFGINFNY